MTKLFLTLLLSLTAFIACEKEYSEENGLLPGSGATGGTQSGTAQFTLAGAPGACVTPIISGSYVAGTPLDASNSVIVTVDVTVPGTYVISTGTANGISFSASGTFTITGLQIIVLNGSGTPAAAGTFFYAPGTNGCSFSVVATGVTPVIDCKACSYIPYCDGSTFTFSDTTLGSPSTSTQNLTYISDTTIDGKTFSKFTTSGASTAYNYHNCTAGVTTMIAYNGSDKITTTLLKANEAVGATWTDVFSSSGFPTTYTWEIMAKGISRTVLGVTFPDVIQVHLTGTVTVPPAPTQVFAEGDYFYARNVGLIESVTYNTTSGAQEFHRVIQSYFIP